MVSQEELARLFKGWEKSGSASNMFIEGDVLYSYGTHFPLLIRTKQGKIIQNADFYSVSTRCQQNKTSYVADFMIPFSSMGFINAYNVNEVKNLEIVLSSNETWEIKGYTRLDEEDQREYISVVKWESLSGAERNKYTAQEERKPETLVLTVNNVDFYLQSQDDEQFYCIQLPQKPDAISHAYDMIKPDFIQEYPETPYIRQGEWFFIDITDHMTLKKTTVYNSLERDFVLPKRESNSNNHTATRGIGWNQLVLSRSNMPQHLSKHINRGTPIVSGQIRHVEHRKLSLSTTKNKRFFVALENNAVHSWSAIGDVD